MRRLTTEEWIAKATARYGDRFDYSAVVYRTQKDKVRVRCRKHGEFLTRPTNHLTGAGGCRQCMSEAMKVNRRRSADDFLAEVRSLYGDLYSYDKTEYKGGSERVTVTCVVHGDFHPVAGELRRGVGCPKCTFAERSVEKRMPQEEFLAKCREAHGDRYDLSQVVYAGYGKNIRVGCPTHGFYEVRADSFSKGQKCSKCYPKGRSLKRLSADQRAQRCSLYQMRLDGFGEEFYKIGVTGRRPEYRANRIKCESGYNVEVLSCVVDTVDTVYRLERNLLRHRVGLEYEPSVRFRGYTECLSRPLDLEFLTTAM